MPTFAAVDIGSNSCRLKIASVQMHRLKTLHEDREVTRLGESVFQTGAISPEAMAATIRALKRFHKAVQLHVADKVRVVATSAMRDARNAEAFTEWVRSATGWDVEVISGLEEGRLIHLGVVTHEVGARGGEPQRVIQPAEVVADCRDPVEIDPEGRELLGQVRRVGVDGLADQQLGADAEDFGVHGTSFPF